ncbi:MAG TPA: electron transporter, partial [Desulfuromonadales bacterium]|nr:electron transporter [Desulfuromonadales bacterium]
MEWTRQIYWNVGHGVVIPMYFFALLAIAGLGYGFVRRIRCYRQGRPLNRLDALSERILGGVKDAFLQVKVLRVRGPGLAHAIFFWSFLTLFAGTLLVMLQADFTAPLFGVRFLQGPFYLGFS